VNELAIRRYRDADHDAVWNVHNVALSAVGVHGGNGPWDDDLHNVRERKSYALGGTASRSWRTRSGSANRLTAGLVEDLSWRARRT